LNPKDFALVTGELLANIVVLDYQICLESSL